MSESAGSNGKSQNGKSQNGHAANGVARTMTMESKRDEPLYNIGAVERLTGIPVATLRVWERRYGFPSASRSEGGHRIYSAREVERLRWVKARIDEGMRAGTAVHALEVAEEQGEVGPLPSSDLLPSSSSSSAHGATDAALGAFHRRLTEALLVHDTEAASRVLGEALSVYPIESLILDVVRPTMVDIGQGWVEGEVSVATEHLATQFVRDRLLLWMHAGGELRSARPTVMASAPGDWHDLGLLMLATLVRRRGWPIAYLGPAVPLEDLASFVESSRPSVVVLSAMSEEGAAAIADWPSHLTDAAERGRPVVCFGGRIFSTQPDWQERIPGRFLGGTLDEAASRVETLLRDATGVI